jgi:hypothetical protein
MARVPVTMIRACRRESVAESMHTVQNLYLGAPDVAVGPDKIVFNLGEHTGNIWMTQPAARD